MAIYAERLLRKDESGLTLPNGAFKLRFALTEKLEQKHFKVHVKNHLQNQVITAPEESVEGVFTVEASSAGFVVGTFEPDTLATEDIAAHDLGDEWEEEMPSEGDEVMQLDQLSTELAANTAQNEQNEWQKTLVGEAESAQSAEPQKPKPKYLIRYVAVAGEMDRETFRQHAIRTIFGEQAPSNIEFNLTKDKYGSNGSPVKVLVDVNLLLKLRGKANIDKGIPLDEIGKIEGAAERKSKFEGSDKNPEKASLLAEIDRRYYEAAGVDPGEKIKNTAEDAGKRALWNQIRDEVLYQQAFIQGLSKPLQDFLKDAIQPISEDATKLEQVFRIAKKLEDMGVTALRDFLSKASGSTDDLDAFEAVIDAAVANNTKRAENYAKLEEARTKLTGLEDLYQHYKFWEMFIKSIHGPENEKDLEVPEVARFYASLTHTKEEGTQNLEVALLENGFESIDEFETTIKEFTAAFEKEAQAVVLDYLARYNTVLSQEAAHYADPKVCEALFQELEGFRPKQEVSEAKSGKAKSYALENTKGKFGDLKPEYLKEWQSLQAEAKTAEIAVDQEIEGLSKQYPILYDAGLAPDKQIDRNALAAAPDPTALGKLLQKHVADRKQDVADSRLEILSKEDLLYVQPKIFALVREKIGIIPGGVTDQIVTDKAKQLQNAEIGKSIALGIAAIAIAIATYGIGTPLAIGLGAASGLGISGYFAYEEYQKYCSQNDLAGAGLADDPEIAWLAVAFLAVVLDMAVVRSAMKALAPAAHALNATGDVVEFSRAMQLVKDAGQIDEKMILAAERALQARANIVDGGLEILESQGLVLRAANPENAGSLYEGAVKMARGMLDLGESNIEQFLQKIRKQRIKAKLEALSVDELEVVKLAWREAEADWKSVLKQIEILSDKGKLIGRFSEGEFLEIISQNTNLFGGNTIKLSSKTTTVTGTLNDVNSVAIRGSKIPGVTATGPNEGAINILRSSKWAEIQSKYRNLLDTGHTRTYWSQVTDEFWEIVNKPWLDEAIQRGDDFRFVSDPFDKFATYVTNKGGTEFVLSENGNKIRSIFGREIDYIQNAGYKITRDGIATKAL